MSATAEVLVLSSSPERNRVHTPAPPAYDPDKLFGLSPVNVETTPLPSPSELFCPPTHSRFFEVGNQVDESRRKEARKNPSILTNAESVVIALEGEPVADKPKRRGRPKKEQKLATEESGPSVAGSEEITAKRATTGARKKRAEPTTKRSKPANKTISGRVAKAGTLQPEEAGIKAICPSTPPAALAQGATEDVLDWEKGGLHLEQAMTRRLDWTPTTNKTKEVVELDGKAGPDDDQRGFGNLLSEYGFNGAVDPANDYVTSGDGGPTKRRRIDLVDPGVYPVSRQSVVDDSGKDSTVEGTSKSKPAARKKPTKRVNKFTTLTARVTAKYINESTESSDVVEEVTPKAKPRASKSKKKGQGSLKSHEPESVVLSPEEAVKSLDGQELVFGTCSQLEREDSPTTIRELQAAISESERSMTLEASGRPHRTQSRGSSSAVSRFNGSGNLWSVASRDVDGLLMQVEVVDLVTSPDRSGTGTADEQSSNDREEAEVGCNASAINPIQKDSDQTKATSITVEAQPTIHAPITQTTNKQAQNTASGARKSDPMMPQYNNFTDAQLSKQAASFGFKPLKNRKKMIELLEKCWRAKNGMPSETNNESTEEGAPPPHNKTRGKGTTRKTTTKATAKRQGGTSKQTTEAISTTSLNPTFPSNSNTNSSPNTIGSTSTSISLSQPFATYANVEEIEDSEDDDDPIPVSFPSPSRLFPPTLQQTKHKRKHTRTHTLPTSNIPSSPNRTTSTTASKSILKEPEPSAILIPLTEQITKAVRAQSHKTQSRDASSQTHTHTRKQTWHEKILMYDPIPLEEFTTWLNTEGLGLVNEDREVGAGFVRRWCESKGVVCCYRPKKRA
ncbi:5'-flap endonuclease [Aspergillus brasiliensis]|nr:5'-flap endonuclease [Aspergillus brasiliensis]